MSDARKSLMRSLGEFVGHVRSGLRTPVGTPPEVETARRATTDERVVDAGQEGRTIIARRTVIEEVEIRPSEGSST